MSKIDEMIRELCPEGVSYVKVENICTSVMGEFVRKDKQNPNGKYPVYNGGSTNTGWYDEYNTEANKIIISARGAAGFVNKVDIPFWAGNSCHVLKIKDLATTNYHYLYYVLKQAEKFLMDNQQKGGGVPAVSKKQVENLEIPLPPLSIQQEIVSVLDSFTTLIDKMKQEVEKRKKQMEYYRETLLSPKADYELKILGEIGIFTRGNGLQKTDFTEDGYPCIHYGQIHTYYGTSTYSTKSFCDEDFAKRLRKAKTGDLLIATTSEDVEACCKATVWLGEGEVAFSGDSYCYSHNQNPKYIAYLFQTEMFAKQKRMVAKGAKVVRVTGESMAEFSFYLPSLAKQAQIVSTLDKFESYISKLEQMITLRQKQYDFYREQLLTFNFYR